MSLEQLNSIRESFSRAAYTYTQAAEHQYNIAKQLVDIFAYDKHQLNESTVMVDLGSGTGFVSQLCEQTFPTAKTIRLDLCETMLKQDAAFHSANTFLCADLHSMPFQSNSIDVCLSSYAFQWANNVNALFQELARVLKQGGCVYFSIPGERTFEELEQAWKVVDDAVHVHAFFHQDVFLSAAAKHHFECLHFSKRQDVLGFEHQRDALRHIKHIGAHNLEQNRVKHLTGKHHYFAFSQAFKQQSKISKAYSLSYHSYFFGFRLKSQHV